MRRFVKDRRGISVGSVIVGLLMLGAMVQFSLSYMTDINAQYDTNLNLSRIEKYNTLSNGSQMSQDLVETIVKKEADTSLSFLSLPLFVWSALKTVITGTLSSPVVILELIRNVQEDFKLPYWVDDVLIAIITVSLSLAITGAVLRTDVGGG